MLWLLLCFCSMFSNIRRIRRWRSFPLPFFFRFIDNFRSFFFLFPFLPSDGFTSALFLLLCREMELKNALVFPVLAFPRVLASPPPISSFFSESVFSPSKKMAQNERRNAMAIQFLFPLFFPFFSPFFSPLIFFSSSPFTFSLPFLPSEFFSLLLPFFFFPFFLPAYLSVGGIKRKSVKVVDDGLALVIIFSLSSFCAYVLLCTFFFSSWWVWRA